MFIKAYFLDRLMGLFTACKAFLLRKGEDNPDFHKVLDTHRLNAIIDGEDGEPSVFPLRRRKLAEAERVLRAGDSHRFNPESQLGTQALHSYSVAVNPKYDGVTLDLSKLAHRIDAFEAEHPNYMDLAHKDSAVKMEKLQKKFSKKKKKDVGMGATPTADSPVSASNVGGALAVVDGMQEAEA